MIYVDDNNGEEHASKLLPYIIVYISECRQEYKDEVVVGEEEGPQGRELVMGMKNQKEET